MDDNIKFVITLLSDPTVLGFIGGIFVTLITSIQKYRDAKEKNLNDFLLNLAKEESYNIANFAISSPDKRKLVIKNIYDRLPKKYRYVDVETVDKAVVLAYQYFVKPQIIKENIINDSTNVEIKENTNEL